MKIASLRIQNLRAYEDVTVDFNDYACLVGANGAGKSTILCALNIFFRQTEHTGTDLQKLDREDFFSGKTDDPIKITVTFDDLPESALDRFKDYARAGKLTITASATFNESTQRADVRHFGERLGMIEFAPFFEAYGDGASAGDLKVIYEGLREKFPDLQRPSTKEGNKEALIAYEGERPEQCTLIPSEDQFYGVSKGANRLAEFVQWVYVPAIKDALTEQVEAKDSALGKLLARTVRARTNFEEKLSEIRSSAKEAYEALLIDNQSALNEISLSLSTKLAEWAHPDTTFKLEWQQDDRSVRIDEPWAHVKVGEGPFEGKLARLGHGLQRSYIIALLQELAAIEGPEGPKLLLAIEEPELYQHPPQARHLSGVLQRLAADNSQVMVSTHSPYFVSGEVFEDVRVCRRPAKDAGCTVHWSTFETVATEMQAATGKPLIKRTGLIAKLQQSLQPSLSELFFASRVILVEGREDVAYLQSYLQLSGRWDEFRKHGGHIVPCDGKSEILRPLIVAQLTKIPVFVVFDSDSSEMNEGRRAKHAADNAALLKALGENGQDPFPPNGIKADTYIMWSDTLANGVKAEIGEESWRNAQNAADVEFQHTPDLKKTVLHVAARVEKIWEAGLRPGSLEDACERIIKFVST